MSPRVKVIVTMFLYFGVSFLTPLAALFVEKAAYEEWPSFIALNAVAWSGLVQGMVNLRAFLDGSYERLAQSRNGSTGQ